MKTRLLLTLFAFIGSVNMIFSQSPVELHINHHLGSSPFAFNTTASNNLGDQFQLSRCEYYISNIKLVHDGGIETALDSTWLHVNLLDEMNYSLGTHSFSTVENIKFYIGVNPEVNHEDPTLWATTHPLAPKDPSMHWGWAAGYRFIAIEGVSGAGFSDVVEIHGLGDSNYFEVSVPVLNETVDGKLVLSINADYQRALEKIDVSAGVITHGAEGDAQQALNNFRDLVFSSGIVSLFEDEKNQGIDIFPNPVLDNQFSLRLHVPNQQNATVTIVDLMGRKLANFSITEGSTLIDLSDKKMSPGVYWIVVGNEEGLKMSEKIVIK